MSAAPRLLIVREPRGAQAAVVVLHGGASRGDDAVVSPVQPSVLRMVPIAWYLARRGRGRHAVYRLLNSGRGWGSGRSPVDDARWAVDEVCARLAPGTPVVLVGHSLGGRAALLAADHPAVRGVVALNAWVLPSDVVQVRDRRVLLVHGTDDRIASPERALALAERLRKATDVSFVAVRRARHAMLRRHRVFERLAADHVAATVDGSPGEGASPDDHPWRREV